jgi:hypothetical protein
VSGLFLVVTATDSALARCAHSANQSSFTLFDEDGAVLMAYQGDLNACKAYVKPMAPTVTPIILHRT